MEKHYCIVLRSTDYKDYDKILALFSRSHGRIDAQARGARRMKSEFAAPSQPLACGEFEFYKKGEKLFLTNAEVRQEFYHITGDYDLFAAACVMLELTEKLLQNADEYEELFLTLIYALYAMEQKELDGFSSLAYFFARIVDFSGIFPVIGECASCGAKTTGEMAAFSFSEGGEICEACRRYVRAVPVRRAVLEVLRQLRAVSYKNVNEIKLELKDAKDCVMLMNRYLQEMLDLKLKTTKFLGENLL
ncbi:MAG: DNA repair protein RecO [Christensenella sp.]|nr:DNA repair protein RecO [Christensenella sp.]